MITENIFYSFFAWISGVMMLITFYKLLTPKKTAVIGGIIISAAEGFLYYAIRFSQLPAALYLKEINLTMPAVTLLMVAVNIGYTVFFFSDKLIRKVSVCLVMFMATIFSETIMVFFYTEVFKLNPNDILELTGVHKAVDFFIKIFIYIIDCFAAYVICRKKIGAYSKVIKICLMGVIFSVLSFLSLLANFNHIYYNNITYSTIYKIFIIITALFMVSISVLIKYLIENERYKYESFWSGELQKMGIEKIEESKKNEEKISRIKHDFKDILTCIQLLVEKGDSNSRKEVQKLISSEISEINSIKVKTFTSNIMINTILSVKTTEAEQDNIAIKADVDIPQEFSPAQSRDIDILTLNLLNNAVEGCKRINDGKSKTVDFIMKKTGNYLFIKTENPGLKPEKNKKGSFITQKIDKKNHGKGINIIEDISQKYNGCNEISFKNNIFCHSVNVELK